MKDLYSYYHNFFLSQKKNLIKILQHPRNCGNLNIFFFNKTKSLNDSLKNPTD